MRVGIGAIHYGLRGLGQSQALYCQSKGGSLINGVCTLPAGSTIGPNEVGVTVAPTATQYSNAPGCYVIDLAANECMMENGYPLQCSAIQECAPLTGVQHCQIALPGQTSPSQTPNPNLPFCTTPGQPNQITPQTPTGGTPYTPTPVDITGVTSTGQQQGQQYNVSQGGTTTPVTYVGTQPPSGSGSSSLLDGSSTSTSGFDPLAFLQETSIDSIPNWVWIAGGLVLFFLVKK